MAETPHSDPAIEAIYARLLPKVVDDLTDLLRRLAPQVVLRESGGRVVPLPGPVDPRAVEAVKQALTETLAVGMGEADLAARAVVLANVENIARRMGAPPPLLEPVEEVPVTRFTEAWADLIRRQPVVAKPLLDPVSGELEPAYRAVQRIYSEGHGFALAKAAAEDAAQQITERVQGYMSDVLTGKAPFPDLGEALSREGLIRNLEDWTGSYSQTVLRTNLNTSVSAGRFSQASHPIVRRFTPAWRYTAILDSRVRSNHAAKDGLIAEVDDPLWSRFHPPQGYNCRCVLEPMDVIRLERMGLLDESGSLKGPTLNGRPVDEMVLAAPEYAPDEGFGQSQIQTIYLGTP